MKSWFDDEIYIHGSRYDGLGLVLKKLIKKIKILL